MRRSGPGRAGLKPTAPSPQTAAAGGIKKVQILYSLDFITKKILPCPLPSCRLSILKATLTPTPPGDGCGGGGFSLLNKRVPAPPSKSAGFCLIRARILKTGKVLFNWCPDTTCALNIELAHPESAEAVAESGGCGLKTGPAAGFLREIS